MTDHEHDRWCGVGCACVSGRMKARMLVEEIATGYRDPTDVGQVPDGDVWWVVGFRHNGVFLSVPVQVRASTSSRVMRALWTACLASTIAKGFHIDPGLLMQTVSRTCRVGVIAGPVHSLDIHQWLPGARERHGEGARRKLMMLLRETAHKLRYTPEAFSEKVSEEETVQGDFMVRLVPDQRATSCRTKQVFATKKQADAASPTLMSYECSVCGMHHLAKPKVQRWDKAAKADYRARRRTDVRQAWGKRS